MFCYFFLNFRKCYQQKTWLKEAVVCILLLSKKDGWVNRKKMRIPIKFLIMNIQTLKINMKVEEILILL